ncbi:MAG: integration host factor subunit alpha [Mariprofundaceae bacterium]
MTKADIVSIVHDRVGLSKKESGLIVDNVLDTIRQAMSEGDSVKVSGFGNFMVRSKNERRGRNPKTGEEIMIVARRVVTFRASHILKARLSEEA